MNKETLNAYRKIIGDEKAKKFAIFMAVIIILELLFMSLGGLFLVYIVYKSTAGAFAIVSFGILGILYTIVKKLRLEQTKTVQITLIEEIQKELK